MAEGTYVGLMVKFAAVRDKEILQIELFQGGFLERPFQKDVITEALSQWILMQAFRQPHCVSHEMANSIAVASTHPMSLPSVFQPSADNGSSSLLARAASQSQELSIWETLSSRKSCQTGT